MEVEVEVENDVAEEAAEATGNLDYSCKQTAFGRIHWC